MCVLYAFRANSDFSLTFQKSYSSCAVLKSFGNPRGYFEMKSLYNLSKTLALFSIVKLKEGAWPQPQRPSILKSSVKGGKNHSKHKRLKLGFRRQSDIAFTDSREMNVQE